VTAASRSQAAPRAPEGLLDAAEAVRAARCRYAEAFLRFKIRDVTDGQAHQQAILETDDELTVLEAALWLAQALGPELLIRRRVRRCR
jgi:hypothetical protein